MPYTVKQLSDDVAEVAYDGAVTEVEATNATNECVQLQRQFSILKFLVVIADDSVIEMQIDRVREIAGQGYKQLELRRWTRIALIRPKSEPARRFAEAYEETCRKRGWVVQVLPDRGAALNWLNEPK
jgi:hypothetical protein